MARFATALLLALLVGAAGCKKSGPAGSGSSGGPSSGEATFRFRPEGGSTTILGKSRDRALDAELMNEMRQVLTVLEADYPNGRGPADKAGWVKLLRDFRTLRPLVDKGEVIAYPNVNPRGQPAGPAQTVLMYEKRVVDHNDGLVLTCDGTPHRMNKAQFESLAKPR